MTLTNTAIRLVNDCPYYQKRIAHCADLGEYMVEAINRQWIRQYSDIQYFEHTALKQIVNLINPKLTLLEQWLFKRGQFQEKSPHDVAITPEFVRKECLRKTSREIIHTKAEIKVDGNWHNCRILNISTGGAKLQIDRSIDLGLTEFLKIDKYNLFKTNVVWRQRNEIGVAFSHDASEIVGVIMGLTS